VGLILQAPWITAKVAVVGQMFRILEPRLPAAMREAGAVTWATHPQEVPP